MNEIQTKIKENQEDIRKTTEIVKDLLGHLLDVVKEQTMLQQVVKDTTRSYYSRVVAEICNSDPGEVNKVTKSYKAIAKRNKVDKIFLEQMGIIFKPNRKNPRKTNKKPVIMQVGLLCGQLRSLKECGIKEHDVALIKQLVSRINDEFEEL